MHGCLHDASGPPSRRLRSERRSRARVLLHLRLRPTVLRGRLLPALLPNSVSLDREAGSESAYLNAADTALQRRDVGVFYDHLAEGEGPELLYGSWPVDVRPRAFHAKLMLLDYGDTVRAVISSANLTAAAWTRNLELFVVEDLRRGTPHAWASGLRSFIAQLIEHVPTHTLIIGGRWARCSPGFPTPGSRRPCHEHLGGAIARGPVRRARPQPASTSSRRSSRAWTVTASSTPSRSGHPRSSGGSTSQPLPTMAERRSPVPQTSSTSSSTAGAGHARRPPDMGGR